MEKYISVATDYTIPVAFDGSERCCSVWLASTLLMFGKVEVDMSRVILNGAL